MILESKELKKEEQKEIKEMVDLQAATIPRVLKYEILAKYEKEQRQRQRHKKEK